MAKKTPKHNAEFPPDMAVVNRFFEGVKAMGGTVKKCKDKQGRHGWKVSFLDVARELDMANVEPIELVTEGTGMKHQFHWLIHTNI